MAYRMTCPHCHGTGMIRDTPSHSYRDREGWTRCTCPPDPWRPAENLSDIDDYIARVRAAEREIEHEYH